MEQPTVNAAVPITPLQSTGASFVTHRLRPVNRFKLSFAPTMLSYLFAGTFLFLGTVATIAFIVGGIKTAQPAAFLTIPVGLVFIWVGKWLLKCLTLKRSVDLQNNTIEIPVKSFSLNYATTVIDFSEIAALQIIPKNIFDSDGSYQSYELNIVLRSGERRNVVDHAGGDQLVKEAQKLASFIGCPVLESNSTLKEDSSGQERVSW